MDQFVFVGAASAGKDTRAATTDDFGCVGVLNSSTAMGSCSDDVEEKIDNKSM